MTPEQQDVAFRQWFGVSGGAARILVALYRQPDAWLSTTELSDLTGLAVGSCKVFVCHLRKALEAESLDTLGAAYSLTEAGMDECEQALRDYKARAA